MMDRGGNRVGRKGDTSPERGAVTAPAARCGRLYENNTGGASPNLVFASGPWRALAPIDVCLFERAIAADG